MIFGFAKGELWNCVLCGTLRTECKVRFTNLILLPERSEESDFLILFYCPEREARFTNLVLARSADLRCLHALQAWF